MKSRWVQAITAICTILLLSGGIVYVVIKKYQKHQRMKKIYDAYTKQRDAYLGKHGLPILSEVKEAHEYLLKHAPNLLSSEQDFSEEILESYNSHIEQLRSRLIFDTNDKVIGIKKDDKIFRSTTEALYNEDPVFWYEMFKPKWFLGLNYGFDEQYPDVMIRPCLSDSEYKTFFPDAVSRQKLQDRTDALQMKYVNRIRFVLDKTPDQDQTGVIELASGMIVFLLGTDFSDDVIKRLQDKRSEKDTLESLTEHNEHNDSFVEQLRSMLIFDTNGKVIGVENRVTKYPKDFVSVAANYPDLWYKEFCDEMSSQWCFVLHFGLNMKYADVAIRPYLSTREYETFFPDAGSRQKLQDRTDALQMDLANRIRIVLDKTQRRSHAEVVELARKTLLTQWDLDFTDAVIKRLQDE